MSYLLCSCNLCRNKQAERVSRRNEVVMNQKRIPFVGTTSYQDHYGYYRTNRKTTSETPARYKTEASFLPEIGYNSPLNPQYGSHLESYSRYKQPSYPNKIAFFEGQSTYKAHYRNYRPFWFDRKNQCVFDRVRLPDAISSDGHLLYRQ